MQRQVTHYEIHHIQRCHLDGSQIPYLMVKYCHMKKIFKRLTYECQNLTVIQVIFRLIKKYSHDRNRTLYKILPLDLQLSICSSHKAHRMKIYPPTKLRKNHFISIRACLFGYLTFLAKDKKLRPETFCF